MTPESARPDGDVVELQAPADGAYVSTLRMTAAGLAARCDLTIDNIEDLRLAVDEACALLLPHAVPESALHARFELAQGQLTVRASVAASDGAELNRDGFAWTVLDALASDVEVKATDGRLALALTCRRATDRP